jgi:hypothetical protein
LNIGIGNWREESPGLSFQDSFAIWTGHFFVSDESHGLNRSEPSIENILMKRLLHLVDICDLNQFSVGGLHWGN